MVESSAEGGAYVCGALLETVGGRLACGWGQCRHRVARHSLEARQAIWDGIVAALPPAERTTVRPLTTWLFTGGDSRHRRRELALLRHVRGPRVPARRGAWQAGQRGSQRAMARAIASRMVAKLSMK